MDDINEKDLPRPDPELLNRRPQDMFRHMRPHQRTKAIENMRAMFNAYATACNVVFDIHADNRP